MANSDDIIIVEALYSFKGKNNDELCFNKGDIITVTQREEGGWWEGTLNDKTGWFPSNYTKECKIQDGGPGSPLHGDSQLLSPNHSQQQQVYKLTIVKEIIESERSHLAELQNLLGGHLIELRKADILLEAEYCQLIGNLEDVCYCHTLLVKSLEEQAERPSREQRIGGVFLSLAPKLQGVHKAYCSNHPRAVCILEKYKDELNSFMEREGAVRPGIMVLTTALSKPFRRLDKYAGMLQEYERHLEEGHPDRGDTQRSSHVYKDLASSCSSIRRQKELELEVVTGRVHGWDGGETLGALGEVLRMGSVALLPDHRDRYLVLFPTTLVMLAVSPRMSAFIFEGNYPLKSIHVTKLEDGDHYKNAFEVTGPSAERIIALCQTKEDQLQWVEVLSQQSRLARSTNFTPHKSSLTSPHVSSSHVSDWPYVTEESTLHPSSRYLCMTCGLPYFLDAMSLPGVKYSDDNDGSIGKEGCHDGESAVNLVVCICKIPQVIITKPNLTTRMLSEQTCEKMYMGRPYTVLTKFFSNMYRRKVITKKLLRYLSGDKQDESQVETVQLRRHRTECSILTGCSSSDDSGDDTICDVKVKKRSSTESSETSESSIEGCIWAEPKVKIKTAVTVTPLLTTENMTLPLSTSNLQKWRYQGKELSASVSSSESGVSTDGSNPYGYVRYYNPEDSNLGLYKPDEMHSYGEISTGMTCSKLCSEDSPDIKGYKSVSSEDSFYSATHEIPVKTMAVTVSTESKVLPDDFSPYIGVEGIRHTRSKKSCSCNINDNKDYLSSDADQFGGVTNSASLPVLSSDYICKSGDANVEPKIVHSSVLNIPANPITLPSVIPSVGSDELSDSTPNICNKTIYENSNSSDDIMVLEKRYSEFEPLKTGFPFKSKPNVVYYVSSCSGDEMGNDGGDYYESQRKHVPVSMTVSHSEPNLSVSTPVDCDLQKVKFSSHFVQLVCDVENPSKVCSCESYSHRSSDSGLADIVHHLEFCPLRSETPGIGRGSCLSHCSQSSQFSGAKLSRCESSYQIRPLTPDCSGDVDSLLPTPMTTPYTSNPLSYTTDSISSLYGSGSLRYSPSSHPPVLCTTYSGSNREDLVFRSGLYAHWWMKASVCPKMLALDKLKKDYLRFRADKKPEVPPKPNFLKPSYHVRRGGMSGAVVKPLSKSTSTQTNFSHGHPVRVHIVPQSSSSTTLNKNDSKETAHHSNPVVKAKLQNVPSHLDIHCSPSIPRNPSFESQSSQISQITVIPKLNYQTFEITPEFQEQLVVPNRKCLNAIKGRLKGSQESSSNSNNSCYELSSLHSFNECCSRDGNPFHVRDSSEGLDVDFHRRASSQSLCTGVSDSTTFTSSIYCKLQPFQSVDDSVEASESDRLASFGVSGADRNTNKSKPDLPPKPKNLLMSWPIQRSKSLPKLLSSVSIHKKSKSQMVPRQGSVSSVTSSSESPVRHCRPPGGKVWSMSCLKPSPPLRPGLSVRDEKKNPKHGKRKDDKWHEDDALILRVIEAYCTSAKTRYTVNSTFLDNPQLLIAEEEKIIVEETRGNQIVIEEKSLVDTVYALKDQVAALLKDYQLLKKAFELEQQSSRNLRNIVKQHVLHGRDDIVWDVES